MSARPGWFLPTLSGYRRNWLGPDILAGVSAGAVVVPQAMAYATIADLPVQIGLYTCMVPMLVYALLGGSRAMSVSTTSTIATLTATTLVTAGVAANSDDATRDLMTLTLLVGLMLLLARLLKLGSLVENINKATIIGIQVGVGATVAVGQLPKMLGVDSNFSGHGFVRSLAATIEVVPRANLATVLLSVSSIAVLLLVKRFAPRVPGPLIVVVGGILLAAFSGLTDAGVALIAPVPQGIPLPGLPSFADVGSLVPGALAIAVMAFLESTSVARGIRRTGEKQIDSDQELLATSAANLAGSFFQTLPAAGGFSQSAVNQGAGARTQLSTLVTAGLAVLVALFLGGVLSLLPQATLAAMVFVAVAGLIDVRGLARLARISPVEFWIAIATTIVGLTVGLLPAVAVGVVTTLVTVLRELNKPRVSAGERRGEVLTVKLEAPLYTANVLGTELAVLALVETARAAQPVRAVVLDMSVIQATSVTVLDTLADLDRELGQLGVSLRIAALPEASAALARKTSWFRGLEEGGRVFPTVGEGLEARAVTEGETG
ncbi:SulP family inorganic anion transporter [Compostimonas suwonensis]|uniref:MFS superfamily sulfate permease-like transporter n=1 Tax=Compostimonas suwonensis TaxID=1048394 RepID=A0A2M9C3B2_9MICO|nr:SulP family inorganic anion transporter [Compostimonas suwonensis]PJJ65031.1 MFS superfamily sulfate permease-like transporter [Compostimonas suwonensis]